MYCLILHIFHIIIKIYVYKCYIVFVSIFLPHYAPLAILQNKGVTYMKLAPFIGTSPPTIP